MWLCKTVIKNFLSFELCYLHLLLFAFLRAELCRFSLLSKAFPSAAHFNLMHCVPTPGGDCHGQNVAPRALCVHPLPGGDRLQELL